MDPGESIFRFHYARRLFRTKPPGRTARSESPLTVRHFRWPQRTLSRVNANSLTSRAGPSRHTVCDKTLNPKCLSNLEMRGPVCPARINAVRNAPLRRCASAAVPVRPRRSTPRSRSPGTCTSDAAVVGSSGRFENDGQSPGKPRPSINDRLAFAATTALDSRGHESPGQPEYQIPWRIQYARCGGRTNQQHDTPSPE